MPRHAGTGAMVVLAVGLLWSISALLVPPETPTNGNMVANPGFEERAGDLPSGWTLEDRVKGKGSVAVVGTQVHSGKRALRLEPNERNTDDILGFNIGQGFDVGPLKGKTLSLSAWMAAEGDAVAAVGAYVIDEKGGQIARATLNRGADRTSTDLTLQDATLDIPTDETAFLLVVICQVLGKSGAALFDDVSVSVFDPKTHADTPAVPNSIVRARLTVDAGRAIREIPRTLYGHNIEWSHGGRMIWDFRTNALSPELIRLTKDLGVTVLRYPGGSFADFYHWRDGIGPQGSRKTTQHQPGDASSRHTFGTDEALRFAGETGAELLITVNANDGTPQEAAEWVRYVNKNNARNESSPRAQYWEIGNEFYIKNDHPANRSIPPEEYTDRLLRFVSAMKGEDPSIKILAIGAENHGRYNSNHYPDWNREVLTRAGDEIDYLAVHNAYYPAVLEGTPYDVRTVYAAMLAAPVLVKANLETLSRQIETYARDHASQIGIAVTEWGPLFHVDPKSPWVDHVKTLASGLFVASTLKVFIESPRTVIANAFKLNDVGFMGWIGARNADHLELPPRDGQYLPTAPYYALQMYTRHFGKILVRSEATSPTYDSPPVGMVDRVQAVPYLDVVVSRSEDASRLYIMAINKNFDEPLTTKIDLRGFEPDSDGVVWVLNGTGIDANTGTKLPRGVDWARQLEAPSHSRFHLGAPEEVGITSSPLKQVGRVFNYTFPAHSVTCLEIPGTLTTASSDDENSSR